MTSAGTDEHPDVAEISAFAEGLLTPERTADVNGHLAHCALCADVRDSLAEIRDVLGTLPGPPRMPDEIARRIDAALAAEALINATAPQDAAAPPSMTPQAGQAGPPAQTAPAAPETADAARTAAGALGGGDAGGSHVSRETSPSVDRPAGRASGATGPGRVPRGGRRRLRALTAVAGVAVLGLGGLLAHSLNDGATTGTTQANPRLPSVATFSGEKLPDKVHELLGGATSQARPNAATGGENSPFATRAPAVPACVLEATGHSGTTPVAAARGVFEGHLSYLVVLPHPSDPRGQVDAYVVDSGCAAPGAPAGATGTVLTHQLYHRG